jgi:CubicO group peptidase (beta-lactamase class C family)
VADASAINPQQHRDGSESAGPIDQVQQHRGKMSQKDVVPSPRAALTIEHHVKPALDPGRLSDTLSALARKHQVPGAQLAIHHSDETLAIQVGELQYESGCPVTQNTAFPIGSITKTFTATVAMILVADGDLELDAPLGEHLPELDNDLGNELTLRQVLSHTGGLAAGPDSEQVLTSSIRRYVLDHCRSENLVLPPGTGFSYSNIGYVLAGHLIETITGMSWWDAIESILLWPLGIEPIFICAAEAGPLSHPLATGHSVNTAVARTRPVKQSLAPAEAPAGGLAVSAVDLVALGLTQLDGRIPGLLPIAYAEQMRQVVPAAEPYGLADGWGLGLAVFRSGTTTWVGHDGNGHGTACYLRVEPANGCAIAFTSNANIGLGMWQELVTELRNVGLPICNYSTIETLGRPTVPSPGCMGTYVNGDIEYSVTQGNGKYYLAIDGEVVSRLRFYDGEIFSQQDLASGEWIQPGRFLRDPVTGAFDGILIGGRVGRRQPIPTQNGPCLVTAQISCA